MAFECAPEPVQAVQYSAAGGQKDAKDWLVEISRKAAFEKAA